MVRSSSFLILSLLLPVFRIDAVDTAGCMLHTRNFNHAKLTQLTWTAEIRQYDSVPMSGHPFEIRIEFNEVGFAGSKGASKVGAMIQNVGHTFADDAFGRVGLFPGLGIYFSSLRRDFADSSHGVHLNLDPATFPKFGRVFEDVDALGSSAKNIYTRRGIPAASPAKPVRITWTVTRRNVVKDPAGEYSKALDGRWVPLTGVFAVWNFRVVIDGKNFDVADYYLPVQYAEYISPTDPLMLHQEYFGSAQQILASQQGEVRYTQMSASDGSTSFPLNNWSLTWRIDDEAGNRDLRFGWRSDGKSLTSVVGHAADITSAIRDVGRGFVLDQ